MLLLVSGNWHTISRMERELNRFANSNGVTMQFKRTEPRRFGKELLPYAVDVVGLDQPGVVHSLSGFFAARKVEIARGLHAQLRRDAHRRADVLRADGHQHPRERAHLRAARGVHGVLRPAQRRRDHGAGQALVTGSEEDTHMADTDRRQENRRVHGRDAPAKPEVSQQGPRGVDLMCLYFYPKDDTPGCTLEGQDFRDRHAEFRQAQSAGARRIARHAGVAREVSGRSTRCRLS